MMKKIKTFFTRPQVWGFILSVAILAVLSVAFFYPDNIEGNTLQQQDMQQGAANGHEGQEYEALTGEKALWTNSLFSGMPTFQISPSYPSNSLFTWLNTVYGLGLPAPSNLLFMMMVGMLILLTTMRMRWYYALLGAIAWGFSSYYIILIGAGHIWKFVCLTYIPPTIAGLVVCYRGRYIAGMAMTALFAMLQLNANHPQMSYYFAFVMVGFVIAYLCEAIREHKMRRWLTASGAVLLAGALAIGANLPSLYNTYEYAKATKRATSELAIEGAEVKADAPRPTGGMPYEQIVGWSYGIDETLTLLIPNLKGGATAAPQQGHMVAASLAPIAAENGYDRQDQYLMQYFAQYFNDSEGTNGPVYVGAIIFALFLLGCLVVRGPLKWVLIVLTALSIVLSWGANFAWLTDLMIYNMPLYNKFRAVESILVIAEFTMPLLGIMGLHTLLTMDSERRRRKAWAVAVAFGAPMLLCLIVYMVPTLFGEAINSMDRGVLSQVAEAYGQGYADRLEEGVASLRLTMVRDDAMRSLLFLLFGGGILLCGTLYKLEEKWVVWGIAVLTLFDLYGVDKRYVYHDAFAPSEGVNARDPFAPDAIDKAISQDTMQHYRVMDATQNFMTANRSYHHKMIGGYHAAKLGRYDDLISRRMRYVTGLGYMDELRIDSIYRQYEDAENEGTLQALMADYRVLDMLNARYIITGDPSAPVVLNSHALGNAWIVDTLTYVDGAQAEMGALATLHPAKRAVADRSMQGVLGEVAPASSGDTIYLTHYTPNTLTYSATVNGKDDALAVFSEVWFPWGWHASIDGEEASLGRVNYVLRALRIPPGHHTVVMTFDPQSLRYTGAVAYASVTIIYLLVLLSLLLMYMRSATPASTGKE